MGERRRRERRQDPGDQSSGRRETERRLAERRRDKRVAAEVLVEVETTGRRTYRRTANISIGGVAFHAPIPFRKGSQIYLTMRLVGRKASIRAGGEIVGVDKNGRGTRVRFFDLSAKARKTLEEHLDLFEVPTQIGVPPSPAYDSKEADKHRVREGLLIVDGDPEGREFRLRSSGKIARKPAPFEARSSAVIFPILRVGFSAFMAYCGTMEILWKRKLSIFSMSAIGRSSPSSVTRPSTYFSGGVRRMRLCASVVLPQPDSPANPMISPSAMTNVAPSSALTSPLRVW